MIIKKLKLENIRSYIKEEIDFPEGITLLSGDIGSGKSTMLLAMDFALFGIRRGELSGSALLRNGSNSGSVTLDLNINNKQISIKRILKKSSLGINQDSAFLTIDDITKEYTPVEIKQKILELLNYPSDVLTKKSMIYRYTVYTPQDEMKSILMNEKGLRLETLRKVFNVDKYKRVVENSKILLTEIKTKRKECIAYTSDLEDKKLKINEKKLELYNTNEKYKEVLKRLEFSINQIESKRFTLKEFENNISRLNNLKNEFNLLLSKLKYKDENKSRTKLNIDNLVLEIEKLSSIVNIEVNLDSIKVSINELNSKLLFKEQELKDIARKSTECLTKKKQSELIKSKIISLENCPMCEQSVNHEHKSKITEREDQVISLVNEELNSFIKIEFLIEQDLKNMKLELETLRLKEREHSIILIRKEEFNSKKLLKEKLDIEILNLEKEILELSDSKLIFESEIIKLRDIEPSFLKEKQEFDLVQNNQKLLEIEKARTEKDLELTTKYIEELSKEVQLKEKYKEKLSYYSTLQEWIETFFTSLMMNIERKIMLKLHTDFNSLFQKWFLMLINTDSIKVRLDEEFTPIIEQNGFDTEYENLSGGEKTACALAYRLALNQVINSLMSSINTRDVIILDEPTDGFSSEQLDRMRAVLEELQMKQIIIVSHEAKIETFADNIIRIRKDEHISRIL